MSTPSTAATIDPRRVRFTAAITCVILAIGLITLSWRVTAAQTVLFGLCAFVGMRLNVWGPVYRRALQPRLTPIDPAKFEEENQVRFAQGVGFAFALVATIGYATGLTALGVVANAFALVASLLNAAFGFCLGCQMFLLLRRLTRGRSSAPGTP